MKQEEKFFNLFFIFKRISRYNFIEPDPFYIQKACFVLSDLYDNGVMNEIERYFKFGKNLKIFDISQFLKHRKKPDSNKSRHNRSKSPIRTDIKTSSQTTTKVKQSTEVISNVVESYTPSTDGSYHSQKDQRHRSPLLQRQQSPLGRSDIENRYLSDVALQDSILYYATSEKNTNGIIFPPRKYDIDSLIFNQIFSTFIQSCFKIKNLFEKSDFKVNIFKGIKLI